MVPNWERQKNHNTQHLFLKMCTCDLEGSGTLNHLTVRSQGSMCSTHFTGRGPSSREPLVWNRPVTHNNGAALISSSKVARLSGFTERTLWCLANFTPWKELDVCFERNLCKMWTGVKRRREAQQLWSPWMKWRTEAQSTLDRIMFWAVIYDSYFCLRSVLPLKRQCLSIFCCLWYDWEPV